VNEDSGTYGYITSTTKTVLGVVGILKKYFDLPIAWTTDVNAAGYGGYVLGNARGTQS
jgi:fructokinase